MSKRNIEVVSGDDFLESVKKAKVHEHIKKHTLESDEEDSDADDDRYNILDENDIQGEEDGVAGMDGEVKLTPFNMKEELEEGHFDGDGHYHWNKDQGVKDHWLDNLDWVKIKTIDQSAAKLAKNSDEEDDSSGSDSKDEASGKKFDVFETYRRILELMEPKETIKKALQRLGKKITKVSTQERFRRKKLGIVDENAQLVTELTELTNRVLTKMGNMDVYEETYEHILKKYGSKLKGSAALGGPSSSTTIADEDDALDMYADDFDTKEKETIKEKVGTQDEPEKNVASNTDDSETNSNLVRWEFKWKEADADIYGPYDSEQMLKWVTDGYFKDGVMVRKAGADSQFYTSNRVDFDLYL